MSWTKTRRVTSWVSFLLFPLTLNYLSPYVSVDGAMAGIVSGSLLVFGVFFLSGMVVGRAWCSFGCPWAAPSEYLQTINGKPVNRKRTRRVRLSVFFIWVSFLIVGFVMAGGIRRIDPLHLTERYISIDDPLKFITYYGVVFLLFILTVSVGRRGACQTVCWMSPFMVLGMMVGDALRIPRLKIRSNPDLCISCDKCTKACPMSIDVMHDMREGRIRTTDCILCGACVEVCPKDVLRVAFKDIPHMTDHATDGCGNHTT